MNVSSTIDAVAIGLSPRDATPAARTGTGKTLPVNGENRPSAPPLRAVSLDGAIEQIKAYLSQSQRQLDFQYDKSVGRTVIKVIDPSSGEVIRQIPAEEVLRMAAALEANTSRLNLFSGTV
jgi:flagellar protein FlaG